MATHGVGAPPSNQALTSARSASVMPVALFIGTLAPGQALQRSSNTFCTFL